MIHFAIRSKSMRSGDRPFTTPGLGDRVHSALLAYLYGKKNNDKVTIHITRDKFDKPHKKQRFPGRARHRAVEAAGRNVDGTAATCRRSIYRAEVHP